MTLLLYFTRIRYYFCGFLQCYYSVIQSSLIKLALATLAGGCAGLSHVSKHRPRATYRKQSDITAAARTITTRLFPFHTIH